jgi:homocysteine S-methyltransferase
MTVQMISEDAFTTIIEVVPPAGPDAEPLLAGLKALRDLPFQAFSVATNPLARPRMSALALSSLIQRRTSRRAILHCTTRDHNRLSLQGLLWGARALSIETVLVATGDFVALGDRASTTTVRDVDVFDLIRMARQAGLRTGVVLNVRAEPDRWEAEIRWLRHKVEAGAQFIVTQPVYDTAQASKVLEATRGFDLPVLMGILPLRTARHARFLHHRVAGIVVPDRVMERLAESSDAAAEGVVNARDMLALARHEFRGACVMPPFDRYDVVLDVMQQDV